MGKNELTKEDALKLIAPIIDNEATQEERKAFMDYIAHHEDVRNEYESCKKIKSLVCTRCPCAKAPDSLREYVRTIGQQEASLKNIDAPIYDIPSGGPGSHKRVDKDFQRSRPSSRRWIFSIAASLLLVTLCWGFFSYYGTTSQPDYNMEEYVYQHFQKHEGKFVPPTISTASLGTAEIEMARTYDMPMTVPALKNADFKGVVYGEFVPDFKAPMLEYYLPSQEQYVYIFAFQLDKLKKFGHLARHQEAVNNCNKPEDFYILNVKGKHVVSWKWDDVWYAAISNHDGNTLASLVKPLRYNPK